MITGKIHLYKEPAQSYSSYSSVSTPITQEEVDEALKEACRVIQIGDLFKYKTGNTPYKVVGFDSDVKTVTRYKNSIAVVWMENSANGMKYHYSLEELFGGYLEKVVDEYDPTKEIPGC